MTQEDKKYLQDKLCHERDKELLLKDLCGRIPYGVKVQSYSYEDDVETIETLQEIDSDGYMSTLECETLIPISKPYLFPLSSMTEEQIEELTELCNMYTPDDDYHPYAHKGIEVFYKHVLDDNYKFSSDFNTDVIDWLNKNHFDYNGLINKGLAIDATGLNIY